MSSLVLPRRFYNQPQGAVQIDRGNKLGEKVAYASRVFDCLDVVSGRLETKINAPSPVSTQTGQALALRADLTQAVDLPSSDIVNGFPLTVSVQFTISGTDGVVYSLCGSSYKAIFGKLNTDWAINGTSAPGFISVAGAVDGTYHAVVVHRNGSFDLYLNGVKKPQVAGSNWGEAAAGNQSIGYRKAGSSLRWLTGSIQDLTVFRGELPESDILSLYDNPHQIFKVSE